MKRTGVCYTQATLDTIGGNPAIDVFMSVVNKSVLLVPPVYRWLLSYDFHLLYYSD